MSVALKALRWMLETAEDQSHGYSQQDRWGPNYDCSSAIISAYQYAGVPVKTNGATYTGNMKQVFLRCGFRDVTKKVNLRTCDGMKKGDVLLNERNHTAMYQGNGLIVHARGQSYGSAKSGDQGSEFAANCNYYNYPWDCVLRYYGSSNSEPVMGKTGLCNVKLGTYIVGCVDPEVKTIQILLNAKGYKGKDGKKLDVDGEFGENTAYAISRLQKKAGLENINFGTVAGKTWKLLIE